MLLALLLSAASVASEDPATALSLRSSASGTGVASPFYAFIEGGVSLEHVLGQHSTIGVAFDVGYRGASSSGTSVGFGNNALSILFEPFVRSWLQERPLDGLYAGVSVPLWHYRSLDTLSSYSWQAGIYGQVGYSLLLARGFVVQASVGPGVTVSWSRVSTLGGLGAGGGLSSSADFVTWALGLRSSLSFGYAF